ncbi:MAG: class A beta-lactamase [Alphaproteobacteria bacterium]|nr:class A beta-lactamase [Alphaproteobacteria bacterium]MCW5743776.1 class A beta-lactamase [Alphaproteobacteria bacterium]
MNRRTLISALGAAGFLPSIARAQPATALNLAALEVRHGGRIGLCADDGDRRVAWRADERFAYCSTFKLFLAACVLERVQRGLETLDRPIAISRGDMVAHAPVTEPAVGSTLTVERLCKAAVEVSDNPAANILIREMGGIEAWRAWYRSIGDRLTRVDRLETDLNTALPDDPRDTTTPAQYVDNLKTVLQGTRLSPDHLRLLTKWMIDTPTGAGRIKAGVPSGSRVAHKTGTGARATHNDIGIVWPPGGGAPIRIVVYFTGAKNASTAQIDAVLAEATRASLRVLGRAS